MVIFLEHVCGLYYMPASVHKLLIYDQGIIKYTLLPIGQLGDAISYLLDWVILARISLHRVQICPI